MCVRLLNIINSVRIETVDATHQGKTIFEEEQENDRFLLKLDLKTVAPMGVRRGGQGGALAPPWIFKIIVNFKILQISKLFLVLICQILKDSLLS